MKAFILLLHIIFMITSQTQAQKIIPLDNTSPAIAGEWERVGNLEEGNIGKVIFYPEGTLNIIHKNTTAVRILRYRLLTKTNPLQGEMITAPFGLGQLKDRITFTIHFNNPSNINFTYTTNDKSQTIYLKKVKNIPHGIVPLNQ